VKYGLKLLRREPATKASADVNDYVYSSLMQELVESGLIDSIYK
jgi:hypothetical protein